MSCEEELDYDSDDCIKDVKSFDGEEDDDECLKVNNGERKLSTNAVNFKKIIKEKMSRNLIIINFIVLMNSFIMPQKSII